MQTDSGWNCTPHNGRAFALGWIGYLGYELKAETGGADQHRSPYPDASMIFADRAIAFDHETKDVYLLVLTAARDQQAIAWLDETERRLAAICPRPRLARRGFHELGELRLRHGRAARQASQWRSYSGSVAKVIGGLA